jgi:hypothetical protein
MAVCQLPAADRAIEPSAQRILRHWGWACVRVRFCRCECVCYGQKQCRTADSLEMASVKMKTSRANVPTPLQANRTGDATCGAALAVISALRHWPGSRNRVEAATARGYDYAYAVASRRNSLSRSRCLLARVVCLQVRAVAAAAASGPITASACRSVLQTGPAAHAPLDSVVVAITRSPCSAHSAPRPQHHSKTRPPRSFSRIPSFDQCGFRSFLLGLRSFAFPPAAPSVPFADHARPTKSLYDLLYRTTTPRIPLL